MTKITSWSEAGTAFESPCLATVVLVPLMGRNVGSERGERGLNDGGDVDITGGGDSIFC